MTKPTFWRSLALCASMLFSGCANASVSSSAKDYASNSYTSAAQSYKEEAEMAMEEGMENAAADAGGYAALEQSNAKRTYYANISLQTQHFDDAVEKLRKLVNQDNGFIQNERLDGLQEGARRYGSFVCRIPTGDYDSFLDGLDQVGNISSVNKWTENITKNYYDTKTLTESLTKERDRLQELLSQAENVADMIAIEDKLIDVENQLQQAQNDLSSMDLDLDYSTIYVDLSEVQVYSSESNSPWKQIPEAFQNTWVYFGDGFGRLMVQLVYLLPWLLLLGFLGAIGYLLVKKHRKNHPSSKTGFRSKKLLNKQQKDPASDPSRQKTDSISETPDADSPQEDSTQAILDSGNPDMQTDSTKPDIQTRQTEIIEIQTEKSQSKEHPNDPD